MVIRRTNPDIDRTGAFIGHCSGKIAIGFSTGNIINHDNDKDMLDIKVLNESRLIKYLGPHQK